MIRRKKKTFCPVLPGNSGGPSISSSTKLKSNSTITSTKEEPFKSVEDISNKKSKAENKKITNGFSQSKDCDNNKPENSNQPLQSLPCTVSNKELEFSNESADCKDDVEISTKNDNLPEKTTVADSSKLLHFYDKNDSSLSEIHAVINSENKNCLVKSDFSNPSSCSSDMHSTDKNNPSKATPATDLKQNTNETRTDEKVIEDHFSSSNNTENFVKPTEVIESEANETNSSFSHYNQSPTKDDHNSISIQNCCNSDSSTCTVNDTSPTTKHQKNKKNSKIMVDKVDKIKSIMKSKRKIIEEQFGWEPKIIRHRNALKKLKSMNLDKVVKEGGDWSNSVRNSLLISDLIYCNPPAESAKELGIRAVLRKMEEKQRDETVKQTENFVSQKEPSPEPEQPSSPKNNVIAPQIRLNEDGSIVLDEESLLINSSKSETVVSNNPVIYENNFGFVTQASFRRYTPKRSHWSEKQTRKFYEALNIVGADFGLMSAMFRHRNDKELRRKFHLERKKNSMKVDEALKQQHLSKWTNDMFMPVSSSDDETDKNTRQQKTRKRQKRKNDDDATSSPAKTVALSENSNT